MNVSAQRGAVNFQLCSGVRWQYATERLTECRKSESGGLGVPRNYQNASYHFNPFHNPTCHQS